MDDKLATQKHRQQSLIDRDDERLAKRFQGEARAFAALTLAIFRHKLRRMSYRKPKRAKEILQTLKDERYEDQ